jgi:hypothetical protein
MYITYATNRVSIPDEVIAFCFSICPILLAALGPRIYTASNINEYQKQAFFPGNRAWQARNADNCNAIYLTRRPRSSYAASVGTAQKTPLPTLLLLLHHIAIVRTS